jgi:hypothetical protein
MQSAALLFSPALHIENTDNFAYEFGGTCAAGIRHCTVLKASKNTHAA